MRRQGHWIFACAVAAQLLGLAAGSAHAQFEGSQPEAAAPLPWAKPLKGGSLRVAAVFPLDGAADLAGLDTHFDLRASLFPFSPYTTVADEAVAAALKTKFDVLLVAGTPLAHLSETTRASLAARVRDGAGLLWMAYSTGGEPELQELMAEAKLSPLEPAPDFATRAGSAALSGLQAGLDQVFAYSGEKSRAVEVRFWKPRPHGHALVPLAPKDSLEAPTAYENYLAIAGGALHWAAGREPEAVIAAVEDKASAAGPREEDTPPQLPAAFVKRMKQAALPGVLRPLVVTLDRPAPRAYALRVQARYAHQPIRWSYDAEEVIRKGEQEVRINVPIGAGLCFLDVWLMDRLQVVDWFTQPLDLSTTPELGEVNFGATVIDANDRLRVSAEVKKDLLRGDLQRPQPTTVYLRVTDAFGRVVALKDVPISNAGAEITEELVLVDLLGPYVHAELFAAPVLDTPLSWWIRERAAYRATHIAVRQPLPDGLALIVDEPGEGSFEASALRREWAAVGVDFIFPGEEPDLGNIAADGMRVVARLGDQADFPGDQFDARSRPGIALRQAAARYAAARPGLYVVMRAANSGATVDAEKNRAAIERVVRETDPRASVALLEKGMSVAGTRGFYVPGAERETLTASDRTSAEYLTVHGSLGQGETAIQQARWLPWFAAAHQADALWVSPYEQDLSAEVFAALVDEVNRVREGYDVLIYQAKPAALPDDAALTLPESFSGVANRFEFGDAIVYAFLVGPSNAKAAIKLKAPEDGTRIYMPMAEEPGPARNATIRLQPGEAAVAVLLPYEVSRIAIDASASVPVGRRLTIRATVKTKGALPGDHVLHVTCFGARGEPLRHYSRTVFAPAGSGVTWLPLAFNDTPGNYRIVVRDVLSGVSGEVGVTVVAPLEAAPAEER